jgi:uncharacterized membrane protein YbaN (DUF454 family)
MAREMADFAATPVRVSNPLVRYALIVAGSVLVAIGVIGIFVPLLPTTVFLLLAAACFGKSSPGAYRWLTTNRWFGSYLHNYQVRRGATALTKATSIATLWLGIGAAIWFLSVPLWLSAMLLAIAAAVTIHLLRLQTLHD